VRPAQSVWRGVIGTGLRPLRSGCAWRRARDPGDLRITVPAGEKVTVDGDSQQIIARWSSPELAADAALT
jgi:hypothetical protein